MLSLIISYLTISYIADFTHAFRALELKNTSTKYFYIDRKTSVKAYILQGRNNFRKIDHSYDVGFSDFGWHSDYTKRWSRCLIVLLSELSMISDYILRSLTRFFY